MKIGFCGAASTGKTTTAKLIEGQFGSPERYKPSIVRSVMERWKVDEKTSTKLSPEQLLALQVDIFEAKAEQDRKEIHGIFDRTLIDQLAYCTIRCHSIMPDDLYADLVRRAYRSLFEYDIIIYFPTTPSIPYEDDGFRVTGRAYQTMQDMIMLGHLNKSLFNYKALPYAPKVHRAKHALDMINRVRESKKS